MKKLSFPFTKNGWTHELVRREGLVALVRRHKRGRQSHWQVVRLRQDPEHVWQRQGLEILVPAQECYPSSESWGTQGWTFNDLSKARQKVAALEH